MSAAARTALALAGLLALYVAGVLIAAGVLSVPLHRALVDAGVDAELRRTVYRLAQLIALLGLVPLLALTGSVDRQAFGFARGAPRRWLVELGAGFAAGVAILGVLAVVLVAAGIRTLREEIVIDPGWLAGAVLSGLVTAVFVSLLEETWFRGGLHTVCRRLAGPWGAIGCVAAIYAVLHFVRPPSLPEGAIPGPFDGLGLLARSASRFDDPAIFAPLLALLAIGTIFGLVRERTGRIAACMGLHAGLVLVIRVLKKMTRVSSDPSLARLAEGYDGVVGWIALVWFAALAVLYARHAARAGLSPAAGAEARAGAAD